MLAYGRGGSNEQLTSSRLTNKAYWHYKPKELFADCWDCEKRRCRKVPHYLHSSAQQDTPGLIPQSDGAVVFGKHYRELEKRVTAWTSIVYLSHSLSLIVAGSSN
jgi:hypothetical protein